MSSVLEPCFDRVFTSQRLFRLLLDAMARPGKIVPLPALDLDPPQGLTCFMAGLAFTLLDRETSFAVLPGCEPWSRYLLLNSGSRAAAVSEAEFIIVDGQADLPSLLDVRRGDLLFPDRGATLMIMLSGIGAEYGDIGLALQGPGVFGVRTVHLSGLCPANLERVIDLNREFPLGVDLILSDSRGALVCIPRSSTIIREVCR